MGCWSIGGYLPTRHALILLDREKQAGINVLLKDTEKLEPGTSCYEVQHFAS
jgi:hypothetical protein